MTTLADQARSQEGEPIPDNELVRVELVDSHGTSVEYRDVNADFNADELASWVGDYVKEMAAEGMSGSVRWWSFPVPNTEVNQ